ncbi:MAG TPA: gliding motility-associated ABC transporter permease subunit GldF [Bacteroidetes bacterium]|nr:gliding motility-associated ABC transporter permease subunit GldF [Bacteroidota bacterium]
MWALLTKEISEFFSTVTGYVVVIVFLVANSLFLWVFPGDTNVLDSGYASLDIFFMMAPWIFLFLVPAVTMRSFAEESRSGTLELLFTRPLTDLQIVLGKYFAGLTLVVVSLLPTLIYVLSIYLLGNPPGNLDMGGIWGSYIGLFFLALVYVAIGIFSSSLTDNPIVAFILAVLLSFILYIGFDFISSMDIFHTVNFLVLKMGINEHFKSMSRGVLDSRDILYFLGLIVLFILMTKFVLQSRRW